MAEVEMKIEPEVETKIKPDGETKLKPEVESEIKPETNGSANGDSSNEPTPLERKIINQLEYYFGDFNLPKDKFFREQVKLDDGWVPLDVMIKCKRLAQLTVDFDTITTALKKSKKKLLEVSGDGKSIRRSPDKPVPAFTEERHKDITNRTVYVKGFPKEGITLDMATTFFEKFGSTDSIKLRSWFDKPNNKWCFKGSIFATFKEQADADKFMETKGLKYGDEELILKWQAHYLKEKEEEYKKKSKKRSKEGRDKKKEGESGGGGDDGAGGGDDDDEEEEEIKLPLGAVLHMKGFGDATHWFDIKDAFSKYSNDIAYIDFKKGNTEGYLRLKTENSAKPLFEKVPEGKLEINGKSIEIRVLEGEEEETFLKAAKEDMARIRSRNVSSKRGRRGRGGWHGGRGRKRKGGPHSDGPSAKK